MLYLFKKLSVISIGIIVLTLCFGIAYGVEKKDTQKKSESQVASEAAVATPQTIETAPAAEAPKPAPKPVPKTKEELAAEKAAQEAAAKKMEMVNAAKVKLNNTSWNITLTQSTDKPNKEVIKDTIRFRDGKIESEKLIAEGFSSSNFTLRIKREDKAIWETMQTGKEGELAFWRGEIVRDPKDGKLSDVMNGVLSRHLNDNAKTVKDYTFMSEAKGAVTPEITEEAPIEMPPAPPAMEVTQPPVTQEAPAVVEKAPVQPAETKPKKKGWGR